MYMPSFLAKGVSETLESIVQISAGPENRTQYAGWPSRPALPASNGTCLVNTNAGEEVLYLECNP
jgi:hypothetical protein